MTNKKAAENMDRITSVIARESDGNIQITFTIPWSIVQKSQEETIEEFARDIEIPGFRKGTAPLGKVKEKISQSKLIEHSLGHILPKALADTIDENKLRIAIYPKFELVSAKDEQAWEVRGITCELPEVNLGDYQNEVKGALRASSIIVPGKDPATKPSESDARAEKESTVLKTLLNSVKINIPKILIEEEADGRLSSLLSRLEKLGLALEAYLKSINKTAEDLRGEYAQQAKEAISIDLILNKVAESENLTVSKEELENAMQISQTTNPTNEKSMDDTENRRRLVESVLRRRKALDYLTSLS